MTSSRQATAVAPAPDLWFERGWATVVFGRANGGMTPDEVDDALDAFDRCLALDPAHTRARFHHVRTSIQYARWERALRTAWPDGPDDVDVVKSIGLENAATAARRAPRDWLLVLAWRLHAAGQYRAAERVRHRTADLVANRTTSPNKSVGERIERVQADIWLGDAERANRRLESLANSRLRRPDETAVAKLAADLAVRRGEVEPLATWADRHAVAFDPVAEQRFVGMVAGRDVAVVGPAAPSPLVGDIGSEIDAHDIVIRTKYLPGVELETTHGTRTDIVYYSDSSATVLAPRIQEALGTGDIRLAVVRPTWLGARRQSPFDHGTVRVAAFEDLALFQATHFAIPRIIYDLLRYLPRSITVYHTNFFTASTTYSTAYSFDQPLYDDRSLAQVVPMYGHDLATDLRFTQTLWACGLVRGDPGVERLMTLTTDRYLEEVELSMDVGTQGL